ncbi:MAG: hypothetical protein IH993_03605 [Proteobacteria bacterium]|nr:hypothetical protein [Pseudomonadota bacterium]
MRWLLFAAAAVALSGCGIPPIISIASLALDFASYGSTGKTITDHGLSAVLQKDCALLRGLKGPVCVAEGSAEATTKPPRDAETRASRRFAILEEGSNRATAHQSTGSDARVTLQSTYATDPSIAPNPVPAQTRGEADRARHDRLDAVVYLRDDAGPARATPVRRQVSGPGYLSAGYLSAGYLSAGYLSPGYLSQGIVPGRELPAERETNG